MKRIFGNYLIGIWGCDNPYVYITPRELEERQEEFEWKADDPEHPENLYPYKDGVKIEYDTEV